MLSNESRAGAQMADTFFLTLDHNDHRRLVAGQLVFHQIGEQKIGVRLEGVTARDLIADVLEAMGDDPPEAREFLQPSRKK